MAFRNLITSNINNAFTNLLGDLAETITFTNNSVTGYDFNTGETVENEGTAVTVRGVVGSIEKDTNDNTRYTGSITVRTSDINGEQIDNYDVLRFRNRDWDIVSADENSFVVVINVARKA